MFHLLAPNAWMNDPCGPCYDPTTGLYHISFQWNPRRNRHGNVAWGNVAWGSATSKDLLSWHLRSAPTLKPDTPYDEEGIFTGCIVPTGVDGTPGKLTAIYTSVSGSLVHYTLPYTRGCETQSIAESTDGGKTWNKSEANPILSEPPAHLEPCGWRDPYVAPWPSLDKALGIQDESNMYGVVSGGIAGQSPTLFLYAIPRNELGKWQFISPLINLGLNHQISRWSGDCGQNWEAGTFMTLRDKSDSSRDFIVVGGEGCKTNESTTTNGIPKRSTQVSRAARSQQWMSGELVASQTESGPSVEMKYRFGGRFDHGCLYGVNSFWDPVNQKQIAWGWIREEDLPQHLVDRQNWSGLMSLPRELKLVTLNNVVGAFASDLESITSLEVTPSQTNPSTHTVRTLGISPASTLRRLRLSSREVSLKPNLTIPTIHPSRFPSSTPNPCTLDVQTCRFELNTRIAITPSTTTPTSNQSNTFNKVINISISHSPTHDVLTTLSFNPQSEIITLHRADSRSVDPGINSSPEIAPHTLFTFLDPETKTTRLEDLEVRMWFDESVLEVFVNGRTVISSRIYPGRKRIWGVQMWVSSAAASTNGASNGEMGDVDMMDEDDDDDEEDDDDEDVLEEGGDLSAVVTNDDSVKMEEEGEDSGMVRVIEARAWDGLRADIRIV